MTFCRLALVAPLPILLSGCLARTAIEVATLPVTIVSETVDAVTTSQAEADRRRGREIREADERAGREARKRERRERRAARLEAQAAEHEFAD